MYNQININQQHYVMELTCQLRHVQNNNVNISKSFLFRVFLTPYLHLRIVLLKVEMLF